MDKVINIIRDVMVLVVSVMGAYIIGAAHGAARVSRPEPIIQRDTVVKYDTLVKVRPEVRYVRVVDTMLVPVTDTIQLRDTTYILVQREERVYVDSLYRATVSGYRPSLDSIVVYPRTEYITTIQKLPAPRWSFGIGVGAAAIWSPFYNGLDAGVGLYGGITYNF